MYQSFQYSMNVMFSSMYDSPAYLNWVEIISFFNTAPLFICAVFCRVYLADHSYVSFRTKMSTSAQDILHRVAEKLQQCENDLILVAVTSSEGEFPL